MRALKNFLLGRGAKRYREVSPAELANLPEDVRLVDVRQPEEFDGELGHIDGATLVPLGTLTEASQSWNKDQPMLLICRSGARSSRAAQVLVERGFTNVTNLRGGMMAVRQEGK